ncbi:hypothetical protein BX616_009413 [Lobosporangium transversale]|uniref:Carboxylesterase n=1 Tax=Lobosporangium transversale TaxID=64571 RepID=A0A1Y2GZ08_9FUNG|nr:Carboxylesterase [Lobosporangium transversale]KAF9913868.1 hypothetical protein BX616_009413 [Lobosporangium transversale]ORZ27540.1 Carboxylesterase [Lobosporangium transversale]|eukprot:XP_021885267.1 Carboxylesterase [Lobosporangium transversale]
MISKTPQISIPGHGTIQGVQAETQPSVAKFLNIPYATIDERWRPAVKAAPWTGIRDCSTLGPACPQPFYENPLANLTNDPAIAAALSNIQYSERDCLNLNIFTPLEHLFKAQTLIPVMVWIHGGGFSSGSNALPLYDGTNFVARSIRIGRPVILVTINYRLNYLGFISSKELVDDLDNRHPNRDQQQQHQRRQQQEGYKDDYNFKMRNSVGNWGLLDQKMALEWVRNHIHLFGGNNEDVTAFGESAGATSISYHLLIPEHHGLFQRAILQSGATTTMAAGRTESEGQRYFDHLCQHFKLDDESVQDPVLGKSRPLNGEEKLARLKSIPATELVKAGERYRVGMFLPTIDSILIPTDVRELVHDSSRYDAGLKSIMIGSCRDDGLTFMPVLGAKSLKRWDKFMNRFCPPTDVDRQQFQSIYGGPPQSDKEARRISAEVLTDAIFLYPNYATSMAIMKAKDKMMVMKRKNQQQQQQQAGLLPPTEMVRFHFDRPLKMLDEMGLRFLGAYHGSELPYVFGSDSALLMLSPEEKAFSDRIMDLWILFAWGETSRRYGLMNGMNSLFPKDTPSSVVDNNVGMNDSSINSSDISTMNGGGLWQEAVVFTEACTIERGRTETLDHRKIAFWERYEQLTRQRYAAKHAAYHNKKVNTKL